MEYYIIYEIGDSSQNNGRYIWPAIYTSFEEAVALIQVKIDEAGIHEDGFPNGVMEKYFSKEISELPDGTLVGNLYDYDCQYYIKKMKMV
jgi:hypothetical protein